MPGMNYSCKNVCGTGPAFTCENDFEEKGNFSSSNFLRFDNFFFSFSKVSPGKINFDISNCRMGQLTWRIFRSREY